MTAKRTILTYTGLKALENELEELKVVRRKEVAQKIKEAREQYYSGKADWDIIRQVKEAVSIPVIGNGDVVSGESALAMMRETGCDGVMIGRGAQGNPWIFSELVEYEKTRVMPARPSNEELKDMMLRHARLQIQYKGEYLGIREMRKHVSWYTSGLPNSARLRGEINAVESYEELSKLLDEKI